MWDNLFLEAGVKCLIYDTREKEIYNGKSLFLGVVDRHEHEEFIINGILKKTSSNH